VVTSTVAPANHGAYPFTRSGLQAPAEIRSVSVVAPAVRRSAPMIVPPTWATAEWPRPGLPGA
jgi:hypothetical protein